MRQQTDWEGGGGHKASFVSVLAATSAAANQKRKKNLKKKGMDGRWHAEWSGTMFKRCLGLSLERAVL